jgi:alginate O-acetyltransferase complex protein AlgI
LLHRKCPEFSRGLGALLFFSTFIDFHLAQKMSREERKSRRRLLLMTSVTLNLGLLFVFKYLNFFILNTNVLFSYLNWGELSLVENLVLPVGISFYTFQSMSYTIDLYRNHSKPYENFIAFATYVSFFPQLIAGPIIRHNELVSQIQESVKRKFNNAFFQQGVFLFTLGLSKKVLIADRIALGIDPVISLISVTSTLEAWLCAIGYTLQLYFDFSGYSDMAIGLGLMFGLKFPPNFNSPYKAVSITDFWRRWHMSLSFWLRDYLYVSLGGNRKGSVRTYSNLLMTMILGGLWHGAAWTFLFWGFFHGLFLAMERKVKIEQWQSRSRFIQRTWPVLTFILVVLGWVLFRATSLEHALIWYDHLFSWQGGLSIDNFSSRTRDRFAVAMLVGLYIVFRSSNTQQILARFQASVYAGIGCALLLFMSLLLLTSDSPFLYFQF